MSNLAYSINPRVDSKFSLELVSSLTVMDHIVPPELAADAGCFVCSVGCCSPLGKCCEKYGPETEIRGSMAGVFDRKE